MLPTREEWRDALILRHGKERQEKFAAAVVAVCGLGGLGSNIAVFLARAGIGKLLLFDFDKVDLTNLQRQQYKFSQIGEYKTDAIAANLKEIAPYTEFETKNIRLTEENIPLLLKDADIICEAFDNPEAKAELVNAVLSEMPEKYLVAASGMAGIGDANDIKTRKISSKFYLCGDERSDSRAGLPLFSSRVALCATHQAHIVLQILSGEDE